MSKKRKQSNILQYIDGCECVDGISKQTFMNIISSYKNVEESTDYFDIMQYDEFSMAASGDVYNKMLSDKPLTTVDAVSKYHTDEKSDVTTWTWSKKVLMQLKQVIPNDECNELKYYLRPVIEFHSSSISTLNLLRFMAFKYLNANRYLEYLGAKTFKFGTKFVCVYDVSICDKQNQN